MVKQYRLQWSRGLRRRLEEMRQSGMGRAGLVDFVAQAQQLETYPAAQPISSGAHYLDLGNYRLYYRIDEYRQLVRLLDLRHRLEWEAEY